MGAVRDRLGVRVGRRVHEADERAVRVILTLARADRQGLHDADYPTGAAPSDEPQAGRDAAKYDLTITTSLLRYAHDVRDGRVTPDAVYRDVELPPHDFDAAAALTVALRRHDIAAFLDGLPPPQPPPHERKARACPPPF